MKFLRLILGALFLSVASSSSSTKDEDNISTNSNVTEAALSEEDIVLQKWKDMDKIFKDIASQGVKMALPYVLRLNEGLNISSSCSGSLMKMIFGLKKMQVWAYRMLDASGKIPNGVFSGSLSTLGDFDGCLSVEVPGSNPFRGQYCTIFLTPPLPERKPFQKQEMPLPIFANFSKKGTLMEDFTRRARYFYQVVFRTSFCVPSTCSREEILTVAEKIVAATELPINIAVPTCDVIEPVVFSKSEIVIMSVLSLLILLVIVATARDVVLNIVSKNKREETSVAVRCLMCFSAYTNTLRLLKNDTSPDSIKFFHGMRVVTILWVLLNHTYFYANLNLSGSLTNMRSFGSEIAYQVTANGYSVVETFFFMSAVLLAYGSAGKRIHIPKYIFRRIWRLTPPFMLVIATSFLIPHIGSGPGWKETIGWLIGNCKANWWANLVYINNFLKGTEMCFDWLWYVPVDTHLYVLALFVLAPMKNRPRLAFGMNAVLFIVATVVTAACHVYYNHHPFAIYEFSHLDDLKYSTDNNFFRTYTHITTCCIGLYVGSYLTKRPKLKIPKLLNILGWLSSMTFGLLVVYGVYDWNQGNVPGIAVSTLYQCTSKVVWALALSYVTIACYTGNGGVITSILSWPAFVPLSRLTYMTYIIHPFFQYMYIGSTRIPIPIDHRTQVYRYVGTIVISFSSAYLVSLLFEVPFMGLDRIMFSAKRVAPSDSPKSKPEENGKFGKQPKCDESAVCTINLKKIENEGQ